MQCTETRNLDTPPPQKAWCLNDFRALAKGILKLHLKLILTVIYFLCGMSDCAELFQLTLTFREKQKTTLLQKTWANILSTPVSLFFLKFQDVRKQITGSCSSFNLINYRLQIQKKIICFQHLIKFLTQPCCLENCLQYT